ncbi:type I-U CRISPR-associated protein Cas7 [Thiorhodococcus minor]|uniref:Type I-U CRISPR-associated protein Cas7 n=2 Tax=Thiorhodococcus minor TaxID=57489 RepID=A0A6M0JVM8_9GAMM|nr:type I-U CRISPR-associated RAMP protein Csb1/Cas7u [Thiorhodococcus minor]NEV60663.1 type I-U CRISPR-associated protein Cas7 [Thiorhodococcus minor]
MTGLTLETIRSALSGHAAAFRRTTSYQPSGGPGDKIFPPTYDGGKYATEPRMIAGSKVDCVLLDSVQSQANRMEAALLEAHREKRINLPLVVARFDQEALLKKFTVTSLDAPHRVADAIFRDSRLDDVLFRHSEKGRLLDTAEVRNATGLFGLNPTALVFGLWDSTGPRGGMGAKFQRALVSEMVGLDAVAGVKTSSRIDPAAISAGVTIYEAENELGFTPLEAAAIKDRSGKPRLFDRGKSRQGKPGNPSKANHSNVTPSVDDETGGFTISEARQTTVLSLTCIRRLCFPLNGSPDSDPAANLAARTALAALGLAAATLSYSQMTDLRSRCQLFPVEAGPWQLLDEPGAEPKSFSLTPEEAIQLLNRAVEDAKRADLPWEGEILLQPSEELVELVRRSQELAAASGEGAD